MTRNQRLAILAALAFLACIVAANYATTRWGMVPVAFGLTATAGTYFAGLTFVLRDTLSDLTGRVWVLALITTGAALSLFLALTVFRANEFFLPPGVTAVSVAAASGVAFLLSELADWSIYEPLRKRGYVRAAVASNVVGAVIDTLIFLAIAGFPIVASLAGQLVGKLTITAVVVAGVMAARALSRQPLRVSGSGGNA